MRALVLALLLLLAAPARAQEATLVADELVATPDGRLSATGDVEVLFEGTRLRAAAIVYDRDGDRLTIEGPIVITQADGTVLLADSALLDRRLEEGILRGARLVLDRRLQIAAGRIDRFGAVSALTGVAATSCQVCPGRAPLWEIRADRIVRDEAAQQLYLEGATFRVRGVPVLWLPALRLPDPRNERATGLLIPQVRTTDRLGFGVRVPVFVDLGPTRDLVLTPYVSRATGTVELRFREAYRTGELLIRGALTRDDLIPGTLRGFVAVDGAFDVRDLDLSFALRSTSDDAYLRDYGQTDADRLTSTVAVSRATDDALLFAEVQAVQSLRDDEADGTLPPFLGSVEWERRRPYRGGTLTFGASTDAYARTSEEFARDALRAGVALGWRRDRVLGAGFVLEEEGRLALDAFRVMEDPGFDASLLRAVPAAAVTLRWPLLRRRGDVADLIEPVASLGWQAALGDAPPNEDSQAVELDFANLHALSRLPGEDEVEEGGRLSLGARWTRETPGWASELAVGKLWRTEDPGLSEASGLGGTASDLLLAARLNAGAFAVAARAQVAGPLRDPDFGKAEARLDWSSARLDLGATYVFLPTDLAEDRPETAAEYTFDAAFRPSARWTLGLDTRYDVSTGEASRTGLSVGWRNECVDVDVSVSRRYTSGGSLEPSTSFGLSVSLDGFSAGDQAVAPGACGG